MSVRLFVVDTVSGADHEYGTDPGDCLVVSGDGGLHYKDLKSGRGTKDGGYVIITDDYISEDVDGMQIADVGGEYTGVGCDTCVNRKWYRRWRCGACKRRARTEDRFALDLDV